MFSFNQCLARLYIPHNFLTLWNFHHSVFDILLGKPIPVISTQVEKRFLK